MLKIYNKEILICAPSKGRAKSCSTHRVLPSVKYFVSEDEYDEYVENVGAENVVSVSREIQKKPMGKCRTLNWIIDNYKKDDNIIFFTDDDMVDFYRVDFRKGDCRNLIEMSEDELRALLCKMSVIAKGIGAKIGGIKAYGARDVLQLGLPQGFRFSEKAYIDGKAFIIFEDDGVRYDEELFLKEDVDFVCKSLLKNKRVLVARGCGVVGKALKNAGGVVDVRGKEEELRQGREMIRRYGGMLGLSRSNSGDGVRKNAVQFKIK